MRFDNASWAVGNAIVWLSVRGWRKESSLAPINPGDEAAGWPRRRPNWRARVRVKTLCRVLSSNQNTVIKRNRKFDLPSPASMCSFGITDVELHVDMHVRQIGPWS
jgi:hypothetical protein